MYVDIWLPITSRHYGAPPPPPPPLYNFTDSRSIHMPLTGIDSFPPTMSAFEAHWAQVNTALGGGGLVLTDGFTLANLTSGRTALMGLMSDKEAATNTRQI